MNKNKLDQFYTKDFIADKCYNTLMSVMNLDTDIFFIEPSAGTGVFLKYFNDFFACDIEPHGNNIKELDFLNSDISEYIKIDKKIIVLGNPPFGKRAKIAIKFINKSFEYADTVAFILPLQFQKYSAQSKIITEAKLIYDEKLPEDSFIHENKDYPVRCCFQIWTRDEGYKDLRLRNKPIITHSDFILYQYNNTKEASKYFDKNKFDWDFAVPRQGYKDYSIKETNPDNMDRKTQWIFFKPLTDEAKEILNKIDYNKLSHKNTSTPGFGKADVIIEYEKIKNKKGE